MPASLWEDQGNYSQLTMVDLQARVRKAGATQTLPAPSSTGQATSSTKAVTRALLKLALSGILQINHLGEKNYRTEHLVYYTVMTVSTYTGWYINPNLRKAN